MNSTTWIEINKTALEHNIQQYRQWLPQNTKISAVVKANAYGHGIVEMGQLHQQNPLIARMCVANSAEALQLRKANVTKPILVLGFINTPLTTVAEYDLDIIISDIPMIYDLNTIGQTFNKIINLHVKIDTGLSRLGFLPHEVQQVFDIIKSLPFVKLQAICSHFTEAYNQDLVHKQEEILKPFWQDGVQVHIANSNSSLHTKYTYDFVRIGAGLYGYLPEADPIKQQLLQPILSLKTKVIGLKKVPAGVSVGYGSTTHVTTKPTTIAVLGVGYYEGIDPELSSCGKVIIHDEFAPIVGRINMNYFMVDVTDIPQTKLHDIAIVLGHSTTKSISAYDWRIGAKRNVRLFLGRFNDNITRIVTQQPIVTAMNSIAHNSQLNSQNSI